jgi:hypothetical protein
MYLYRVYIFIYLYNNITIMVSRYTSCALAWILCMSLHIVCTSFVNTITKSLNDPYLLRSDAPELTNQTTNNKQQTNKQQTNNKRKLKQTTSVSNQQWHSMANTTHQTTTLCGPITYLS